MTAKKVNVLKSIHPYQHGNIPGRDNKINFALDSIIKQTSESSERETIFTCFGKSIGMQLEAISLNSAIETMAEIQQILSSNVR